MDKKTFIVVLCILVLFSLNFSMAHEVDDSAVISVEDTSSELQMDLNQSSLKDSSLIDTHIDIVSNTTFDVVGDYFKVKLSDVNNNSISNAQISFIFSNATYVRNTDSNGVASLKIGLVDGDYNVTSKFLGDSKFKASSSSTTITVNNTRIVGEGLSNAQIQQIIDNAKVNNIILFVGSSYENVNLAINKRLTLLSKSGTVLKSSLNSPVITVSGKDSSYTTVQGFVIKSKQGISISNSNYVIVSKNEITTSSDGIVADSVKYLNITKNDIVKNSGNGIVLTQSTNSYILNNEISNNGANGIVLSKSKNTYIYHNTIKKNGKNGIFTSDKVGSTKYGSGPENLYIGKNTINENKASGLYVDVAGDNVKITGNTINKNSDDGLTLSKIGSYKIQSNEIYSNYGAGVQFAYGYIKTKDHDLSYNVIYGAHKELEAKDTYYEDNGERLSVGDNWYTDYNIICPKVNTFNIQFAIKQVGKNTFTAGFYDSKGNLASLLPDRELTVEVNGKITKLTISGGIATFQAEADSGDEIKATVDKSDRITAFDGNNQNNYVPPTNSVSGPDYPSIQYDDLYDMGNGGTGQGNGNPGSGSGSGNNNRNSQSEGNSTTTQRQNPTNNPNNPISDVSQSADVSASSDAGASTSGSAAGQSVAKQIIIDEDEFFRVTGISFIVLLIILTIGFYYREDIKEMKSKM